MAQHSFPAFCAHVDKRFASPAPFQRILMREYSAALAGETRFLAVTIPPRHTKTTLGSVLLPIFALGLDDRKEIVLASHSVDLAQRNSRNARDLLFSERWPFPDVSLAKDSTAATRWHVNGGGSVRALGTGSFLLGRGADLMVIDDALADGDSDAEAQSAWDWFTGIASSRINTGGTVIIIGQRLRDDDLIGRILESEIKDQVRVVNLKAICEDPTEDIERELGRKKGDALWESQYGVAELELRRKMMGTRVFTTQYQQTPPAQKGAYFHREWFSHRYTTLPPLRRAAIFVDGAWKEGVNNSNSAMSIWGQDHGGQFYLVDAWEDQLEYPDLKRAVADYYARWRRIAPTVHLCVEDAASGTGLVQELRRAPLSLPIVGVPVDKSKEARAEAVTPQFEAGLCHVPANATWLFAWIETHIRFPRKPNDAVDCTSGALTKLFTARALYVTGMDEAATG
jgi:predicted phage terminase large subunit-like protein